MSSKTTAMSLSLSNIRKYCILLPFICLSLTAGAFKRSERNQEKGDIYAQNRREVNKYDMFRLGIGLEYEQMQNSVIGARLVGIIGSWNYWLNGVISIGWDGNNYLRYTAAPRNKFSSFPFEVGLRFNIANFISGQVYLGAGGGINLIADENDAYLNPFALITNARIGYRFRWMDISLLARFDNTPAYNQKAIYESVDMDYYAYGKSINERFRIGISILFTLPK